jgi:hypothetical protein
MNGLIVKARAWLERIGRYVLDGQLAHPGRRPVEHSGDGGNQSL